MLACEADPVLAASVKEKCASDFLFWINTFAWTHDPRLVKEGQQPYNPFVTYPFQDNAIAWMRERLGHKDCIVVKSRGVGVTWMVIAMFVHAWLFKRDWRFGLVSREEREVDGMDKSLFAKVDRLLEVQPDFLLPGGYSYESRLGCFRKELLLKNFETRSVIEGSATTGNMFRGDRHTAILWDEMAADQVDVGRNALASTQFVTECRIMVSTPQGGVGAFAEQASNRLDARRDIHWSEHPVFSAGMEDRPGLNPQGKWSPWYQEQRDRMVNPAMIAQELDLDFVGSSSPFFPSELVRKLLDNDATPPYMRGVLEFDIEKAMRPAEDALHQFPKFVERDDGNLWLWLLPAAMPEGKPRLSETFVVGVDVASGTGATNSVLSIVERRTGEKVAELATPHLSPDRMADLAVGVARWFNDAFLIWEVNGPGGIFGQRVMDLGYRNVYYRTDEQSLVKTTKPIPGWHASNQSRRTLFGTYLQALSGRTFINRSRTALEELRQYVYLPNGSVANSIAQTNTDPSGAGQNHGDRVAADALACQGLRSVAAQQVVKDKPPPQYGSWQWRREKGNQEDQFKQGTGMLSWESSPKSLRGWQESPLTLRGW